MSTKVLLTGSSRGIGKAIKDLLLQHEYSVIGTSTSEIQESNSNHSYKHLVCNLELEEELKSKIKPLFEENEIPEVVINNAGIFVEAQFTDTDEEWMQTWDLTQQVNLRATALICKWAINKWLEKGINGRIINVASRAGVRGDTGEYAAYAASKAGMIAFTKSIARSLGSAGITAYSIAPGFVNTDMAKNSIEVYGEDHLTKDLALNSIAPPEQIAEIVMLLASGKLTHATGQTFHVNSGSYLV
ncbi:SDR family oxidoreductase [Balneola vulgaris]|uniref:SDR family oxidoreductase n=1 Tax=Balneola vulgaris TaxID=287535 RepID=UPI000369D697|nr:SDR family oxidoreductase [Balneola vulgaris]